MCELDRSLIQKASVFVESRETALAEAGELIDARDAGATHESNWHEMGEVVRGDCPGRVSKDQVSFYKSVGHGVFDLFAASAIYREAEVRGLGTQWDL